MKKAVLITTFIFILLSISLVSAGYNSAKSNIIANRIHGDVLKDVDSLLKEVKKAEPRETAKKGLNAVNVKLAKVIQVNVSSSVILLKGSWDELGDVPCDFRGELGLPECETVAVAESR